ncbi:ImmA/IrrE family metallo-endopeptidase [Accumulibacter sp.]|uniref:ImmA/IrrE family metallo-endopeptidase n=1 Tax=Accumulibacter sp. TaxID=2053492 RepID=UPI002A722D36|nr:ImmA/IrrE family metallo-endopeptidase [Accumulibacter sp.]
MIGDGPLGGFRVAGRSIADIRVSADNVRRILGIGNAPQDMDIGLLLDRLSVTYGITYDVLYVDEMPHPEVEACWDPESITMHIRTDVFERACRNDPRARFTVMHELGHGLLGHRRTINRLGISVSPKVYEDSEWQANQFAAEFLMPLDAVRHHRLKTAFEIERHFNASSQAATRRANQLGKRGELPC